MESPYLEILTLDLNGTRINKYVPDSFVQYGPIITNASVSKTAHERVIERHLCRCEYKSCCNFLLFHCMPYRMIFDHVTTVPDWKEVISSHPACIAHLSWWHFLHCWQAWIYIYYVCNTTRVNCPPFSYTSVIVCITSLMFIFIPWHFAPSHCGLDDVCPLHDLRSARGNQFMSVYMFLIMGAFYVIEMNSF